MGRGGNFFHPEARYFLSQETHKDRINDVLSWAEEISEALAQKEEIIVAAKDSGNGSELIDNYDHIKEFARRIIEEKDINSFRQEEAIALMIETIKAENYEMVGFFDDFLLAWGLNLTEIFEIHRYLQKRFDLGESPSSEEVMELIKRWQS